jgi:hypothetical protein
MKRALRETAVRAGAAQAHSAALGVIASCATFVASRSGQEAPNCVAQVVAGKRRCIRSLEAGVGIEPAYTDLQRD